MSRACSYSIVVPTIGRPSLATLLTNLAAGDGPVPESVVVVDDRPFAREPLSLPYSEGRCIEGWTVTVLRTGGTGPAAARNAGWRASTGTWVVFLDDDVIPEAGWRANLAADLADQPWDVGGTQGRVRVPLPTDRRPTDWERNVAGLERARWITADLAYRRDVLEEVGGFDERFPRAFREDADLGLRVTGAGYLIVKGRRRVIHPVRPAGPWVSIGLQGGNADDVLMRARHGSGWRVAAGAEESRNLSHLLASAAAAGAVTAAMTGRRATAVASGTAWLVSTGHFAMQRIAPGPRDAAEVLRMAVTSVAIPPAATWHTARGWFGLGRTLRDRARAPHGLTRSPLALEPPRLATRLSHRPRPAAADPYWRPAMVLFDRDGTLVVDSPGLTDPAGVVPMPGARAAVRRARAEGLQVGVVTNQAAVGRGRVTRAEVDAINVRIDSLLGPFDTWQVCPHRPEDGCGCRKPQPGLVTAAADAVGVGPGECAVLGDIGSDMHAARAAGARGVLVPTPATRPEEIAAAPAVAPNLLRAVDLVLAGMC